MIAYTILYTIIYFKDSNKLESDEVKIAKLNRPPANIRVVNEKGEMQWQFMDYYPEKV